MHFCPEVFHPGNSYIYFTRHSDVAQFEIIMCYVPAFLSSPYRAATLVRRTKGEKRGRSHPLRCGRLSWYGGIQGKGDTGVSEEAAPAH